MAQEIINQLDIIPPREKAEEIIKQQEQMYFFFLTPESKCLMKQNKIY